jgi:hypothetical protein
MILGDQEVFFRQKNFCYSSTQRRPYGQLGSVEKKNDILCVRFSSGFAPLNEQGKGGMAPGCGLDDTYVTRIVNELQNRKVKRGSIAQMKKLEYMVDKTIQVARRLPNILEKMGGMDYTQQYPPKDQEKKVFPTAKFDVSRYCEMLSCTFRELELGQEEATYTINKCFGMNSHQRKREYAELGFVQSKKSCFTCYSVDSDLTPGEETISSGFGCDKTKVLQIVAEMRERLAERGDIGQMRKQEIMYKLMSDLEKEWPLVMQKLGMSHPPSQAELSQIYGEQAPDFNVLERQSVNANMSNMQQVEEKTFDITNFWEACCKIPCACSWRKKLFVPQGRPDGDYRKERQYPHALCEHGLRRLPEVVLLLLLRER